MTATTCLTPACASGLIEDQILTFLVCGDFRFSICDHSRVNSGQTRPSGFMSLAVQKQMLREIVDSFFRLICKVEIDALLGGSIPWTF